MPTIEIKYFVELGRN